MPWPQRPVGETDGERCDQPTPFHSHVSASAVEVPWYPPNRVETPRTGSYAIQLELPLRAAGEAVDVRNCQVWAERLVAMAASETAHARREANTCW